MDKTYCVYILASRSRNLYTGVTNNLQGRLAEHREGLVPGFTSRYRIFRLVHFEVFGDIRLAIAREKEIKGWRREKKIWLIERRNRTWEDLAEGLFAKDKTGVEKKQIPHPHPPTARLGSHRQAQGRRDDSANAKAPRNRSRGASGNPASSL